MMFRFTLLRLSPLIILAAYPRESIADPIYVLERQFQQHGVSTASGNDLGSPLGNPWTSLAVTNSGFDSFAEAQSEAQGDFFMDQFNDQIDATQLSSSTSFDYFTGNGMGVRQVGHFDSTLWHRLQSTQTDSDFYPQFFNAGNSPADFQRPNIAFTGQLNIELDEFMENHTTIFSIASVSTGLTAFEQTLTQAGEYSFSGILLQDDYEIFLDSYIDFDENILPTGESYSSRIEFSADFSMTADSPMAAVPEPATVFLVGLFAVGFAATRLRSARKQANEPQPCSGQTALS